MTLDITVTDMFCGAGGSTTGAVMAGARVQLAINHWQRAIETHNSNYPQTLHALTDLHKANPRRFPSTTILVASPECTAHTLAKGKSRSNQGQLSFWDTEGPDMTTEAEERSRCTMWTPLDWAEAHDYQAVILENVVDAHFWRPFSAWLQAWKSLDYDFEIVYLNSMHAHPTPQSRDRMYFVAWKHGNRKPNLKITPQAWCQKCEKNIESVQSWKNPLRKWGKYKQQYGYRCPHCASEVTPYYYAAANAIDWSIVAPRIGDRERPLREKTMRRIAYGLEKFARQPFTVQVNKSTDRVRSLLAHEQGYVYHTGNDPLPTQTTRDDVALILPFIAELHGYSTARSVQEALATVCAGGQHHGLVVPPFILDHLGEYRPREITRPLSTVCAGGEHQSIVLPPAWLMTYYQHGQMVPVEEAAPTVTTLERHALVTGNSVAVEDCGFRMLVPKEIQAAMAFPQDYILTGTRREQVKQLGNAVTPPVMKLLMQRVLASLDNTMEDDGRVA